MSEQKNVPTPHIEVSEHGVIAKTVIMPGDPLRAKMIAEKFLENPQKFNTIRNMFGYTGTYKGKEISVMGSGMGMPSIGIYSYELFKFYDVDNIIRVGSAGAYTADLDLYDVVIASSAYSESTFAQITIGSNEDTLKPSEKINQKLVAAATENKIDAILAPIHSSDVFYRKNFEDYKTINAEFGCVCVEMESFALFANAIATGKNAACLVTISDNLVTQELTTAEERQNSLHNMIKIALDASLEL
ncbi:MAG: purine-nucleoside phosphorylase [Mycoplasmatales bacterium]